jgi:flagellar hook assembly protein FlgD
VTLAWEQPEAGPLLLQIIDLQGKMIFSQKINAAQGRNEWSWNGRDAQGAKVPAGACTVVLQGEGWRAVQPLLRQ